MKIAHLVHHLNPYGTERVILSLLRYRGEAFREQFVVSTQDGDIADTMRGTGCPVYVEHSDEAVARRLAEADLTNAHCLYVERGAEMLEVIRRARRPHLFTLHWPTPFPQDWSPVFLCTSRAAACAQSPQARVHVIENGIDLEPYAQPRRRAAGGRFVILRVCRPEKCDEYFWYAMADVLDRHPDVEVRIIGSEGLAGGRVNAAGVTDDVPAALFQGDLFVYTPRPGEGTKDLVVMEAMAAGLPAVFSDVETVRASAVHGKSCLLVPFGDTEALVCAVETLITQPELRAALGNTARRVAFRRFDMRDRVRSYEAAYRAVLAGDYTRQAAPPSRPRAGWRFALSRR
jgi:glycosyltransferase involved in cell wall biosynthesis